MPSGRRLAAVVAAIRPSGWPLGTVVAAIRPSPRPLGAVVAAIRPSPRRLAGSVGNVVRLGRVWLTAVVFVITAVPSLLQIPFPAVLTALERTPAVRDGEVWRLLTSLTVQDGGLLGTFSNLLFLAVVGATAELVLPRWLWLLCYLAGGLTGQLAGLAWQPIGAGNSVAVCGLAGALAVLLVRGDQTPQWTPMVVAWWCGALGGTISAVALLVGVAGAVAVQVAFVATHCHRLVGRFVGYAVPVFAVGLIALRNVHGPPLLVGGAIALAALSRTRP